MPKCELSIVIPVLNEAALLPGLLALLGAQQGVVFELLLCDGGSSDGSPQLAAELAAAAPFPVRLVQAERGRGRQLNAGSRLAAAPLLLFLHADSAFADPLALRRGLDHWRAAADPQAAGHFALRFARRAAAPSLPYYYYECKARLDRAECTHGDQGLLLSREFFAELGGFDEAWPLLEDTRLAETIRRRGRWLLLPAEIVTSARRFESEGLCSRQVLNALIMNFAAIGWQPFFAAAGDLYREQDRTAPLDLLPYLEKIGELFRALPRRQLFAVWYATGRYVRPHAWQLAFAVDVRHNFRRGLPPGVGPFPWLARCDRWFPRLTDHPPGHLAAMVLVWCWYRLTLLRLRRRPGGRRPPPPGPSGQ